MRGGTAPSAKAPLNDEPDAAEACAQAADEAVRASDQEGAWVKLLKVRGVEVVKDARHTYVTPTGADTAVVLVCEGVGAWSDGDTKTRVRIKITVDADDELFVAYAATS